MVMMIGNKSNVKTFALMLVVVGLVALEQTLQVQASVCCVFFSQSYYYWTCREVAKSSIETCCKLPLVSSHLSEDGCSFPYVNPELPRIQGAADYPETAINYCKLGCTSSLCKKPTSAGPVVGSNADGKDAIERCNSACHDLCTKENAEIAKVHDA